MRPLRWLISVFFTIPASIVFLVVMIWIELLMSWFDRSGDTGLALTRFWARGALRICGVRVECRGLERIDPHARYICVSNHASLLDIPILVAHLPLRLCFLAKEELFHVPVFCSYLKQQRHIPVVRGNNRAAARSMADAARAIAVGNRSLLLFPEGTRHPHGLGEFREGAALLAIRSGAPVVPVAIAGTGRIWPKGVVILPGKATVSVGDVLHTEGLKQTDRAALNTRVRDEIARMLG